ncbi:hypothetical protein F2Q69_00009894 [Brassica cretica]|uniref:Uncharacterized protein n=1 Tax=Brassica cretica TaxID=69181 RepID=A0A8S9PBW3_BRACR|nr:hypothetical protein F2Q69_00009894 [Brassica cretica]
MASPSAVSEDRKSDDLEIVSVGALYSGSSDKKYWSSSRSDELGYISCSLIEGTLPMNTRSNSVLLILNNFDLRTVSSEISEEIPTSSPRKCFFGMSSESLIIGIPSEFSEEILLSDEKFPTTILVGMSSEYRYSEDIPTIFVVGIPV